jgi:hypothetical protein
LIPSGPMAGCVASRECSGILRGGRCVDHLSRSWHARFGIANPNSPLAKVRTSLTSQLRTQEGQTACA